MGRLGAFLLGGSMLLVACASGNETAAGDRAADDDVSSFCAVWNDMADLVVADSEPDAIRFERFFDLVDAIDPVVPDELATDWLVFVGFNRTFRDVLVTVEYQLERVDGDLLARGFGDSEAAETQGIAADAAFSSIQDWTQTGCGDICVRWLELRQALDQLGSELEWVRRSPEDLPGQDEDGQQRLARFERMLANGAELIPEAMRADWDLAVAARADWALLWEFVDYDPQQLHQNDDSFRESEAADWALEVVREAPYLATEHLTDFVEDEGAEQWSQAITAWQAGAELPEGWDVDGLEEQMLWMFWQEPNQRHRPIDERMQAWLGQNCDTAGAPGRLFVNIGEPIDDAAGSTLVLALVRRGGSIIDLSDVTRLRASTCGAVGANPWKLFWENPEGGTEYETWVLSAESGLGNESSLCWHSEQQVLGGGDHTVIAAVFPGSLVGGGELLPVPTLCSARDVTISGDTEVVLPAPGPCDATGWPDDLTEDPWRNSPAVAPDTPGAGTLKLVVPSLVLPEQIEIRDGAGLSIVALPVDTTLNDIGREQVWPLGIACLGLRPNAHIGDQDRRRLDRPTAVPLGPVPVSGGPGCLDSDWLAQDPPDDRLPLVLLPPGELTVLASLSWDDSQLGEPGSLCAVVRVLVDGDTVVELPEWGECPK